ncbi:putative membrane protein [Litoreibacter meonggei]|uniref:Putative membrane protein n=1 Tax=Litoreibacter meonggei TaxID=1049199 RepID=A0A497UZM0_9RHOB|nr:DUF1036 domain-containing protein [Litoreibacter meonggei]RLJ36302.1 putative membrane protein [Litoreibacter meonggei]
MKPSTTSLSYPIRCVAALISIWVGGIALGTNAAHAEFAICNQSFDVVNVAIGHDVDGAFQTEGWWTIGTNQCANVIRDELESRYIYVYAQDVFGKPILNGTTTMCIEAKRFTIRGISSCWSRGHIQARFIEVDTEKTQRWSLFLAPPN